MVVAAPIPDDGRLKHASHTKQELSPGRTHLLEDMQALNFGRMERLSIMAGDPVFDPPPTITREVKFGSENGSRPELSMSNFALKRQVQDLFAECDRIGDGVIEVLIVKHGLPFSMQVTDRAPARTV